MYYRLNDKEWRCLTVTPRGEVLTQLMIKALYYMNYLLDLLLIVSENMQGF